MAEQQVVLTIDVTDWNEARKARNLPPVASMKEALEVMADRKMTASEIGTMLVAAREVGTAPADILPPNKIMLRMGVAEQVIDEANKCTTEIILGSGRKADVPDFVGGTTEDTGYVRSSDPDALARVEDYLLKTLIGHARPRLAVIAASGGDVLATVAALKAKLDELAAQLAVQAEVEMA
jgi:hypothetical protein